MRAKSSLGDILVDRAEWFIGRMWFRFVLKRAAGGDEATDGLQQ